MNKKLPRIASVPIRKKIDHNRSVFYSKEERERKTESDTLLFPIEKESESEILEKINSLFHSTHHSFSIPVLIVTKEKTYRTRLAGKMGNILITMDDEEILLTDILSFEILNK